jgi:hypothetical protein
MTNSCTVFFLDRAPSPILLKPLGQRQRGAVVVSSSIMGSSLRLTPLAEALRRS